MIRSLGERSVQTFNDRERNHTPLTAIAYWLLWSLQVRAGMTRTLKVHQPTLGKRMEPPLMPPQASTQLPTCRSFVQRANGTLRLNVHFNTLALDGVYVRDEGELRLRTLGEPTEAREIGAILGTVPRAQPPPPLRQLELDFAAA